MKAARTPDITPRTKARPKRPRSPDHYPLASVIMIQRWWKRVRYSVYSRKIKTVRSNLLRYRERADELDFETQEISSVMSPASSSRTSFATKNSARSDRTEGRKESSRAAIMQILGEDVEDASLPSEDTIALKARVSALELERQELTKTIDSFKLLAERLRQDLKNQEQDSKSRLDRALALQKEEFEVLASKNIAFTEALLAEKEQRTRLLADIQRKYKESELKYEQQLEELRRSQAKELKKNKDAWATAEKLRRDAWEKQRAKEIREQTARGLEPEIMRIMNENNQKLDLLREDHKQALIAQKSDLLESFEERLSKAKESWRKETDELLLKEREKADRREQELVQKHDAELQSCRRRAADEAAELRRRLDADRETDLKSALQKIRSLEDDGRRKDKQHETDLVDLREEMARRHNSDLQRLKEQLNIEKEAWVESQAARNQKELEGKAKALREELVRQRDAEINSIIQKLGSEQLDTKKLLNQQYDKKLAELKSQHANELSQYQVMVNALKEKVEAEAAAKRGLVENLETLGRRLQELEGESKGSNAREAELLRKLQDREADLRRVAQDREAAVSQAVELQKQRSARAENEVLELKARIEALTASHDRERERMEQEEAARMEELEEKVKAGMRKKDEAIKKLREEVQMGQARNRALTEMLERQRNSILQT